MSSETIPQNHKILVTGAAGFIGFHLAKRLLERGDTVVGLDNLNDYYDVNLKKARLAQLQGFANFSFVKQDMVDRDAMSALFAEQQFDKVVNLAAQPGVRYSLENPHSYTDTNVVGFLNVLEGCRHNAVKHLVFASSSSVYGANTKMPFSIHDNVDHPVSLYAATKKANELMAHTYAHLYGMQTTGLRFFTVYGPWSRPDMAMYLFADAMTAGRPINVYNNGKMRRDFTYIDDIVEGTLRVLDKTPEPNPDWSGDAPDPGTSYAPYRIYNIGNHDCVELMDYIRALEDALGMKAEMNMMPMQPGDVLASYADIDDLKRDTGYKPSTPIARGVANFVSWYRDYHQL